MEDEGNQVMSTDCLAFMKAVQEMMPEKCGLGAGKSSVQIEGITIEVPDEMRKKLRGELHTLSFDEQVRAVEETSWLTNLSTGFIAKMFPFMKLGTPEFERARKSYAHKVAEGMVKRFSIV